MLHFACVFLLSWMNRRTAANRVLLNGAGVAAGDFDRDGWVGFYFCGLASEKDPASLAADMIGWV